MKARKFLFPLFVTIALLLNSCILKSLNPFYVDSAISFEKTLIGQWTDLKKGKWEVASIKEEFKKDKESKSKEDLMMYKKYKDGFFIKYTENKKEAGFIAVPFRVNNVLFMDFNLFDFDGNGLNDLVRSNIIETHTVAKVDILKDGKVSIRWLDDQKIIELFMKEQIQIKHEKVGFNESLVLTGSSKELFKFLKKYLESDIKDKWDTDKKYILDRING